MPLKIVQVFSQFLPSIGGIQIEMYNIGKRLVERGHSVTVFTSNLVGGSLDSWRPFDLPSEEFIDGIYVKRFRVLPLRLLYKLVLTPSIVPALLSVDTDVFHVFSFLPTFQTNIACLISKDRKIPLVITPLFHPSRFQLYTNLTGKFVKVFYDNFIGLELLKRADCVIALTKTEAQYYLERGIKNVHVIPLGMDLKDHIWEPEALVKFRDKYGLNGQIILSVGRLERRKGLQYLVKAMPLVLREFPNAKLLLIGSDSGYLKPLKDLTQCLGIEKAVVFTGPMSWTELSCPYELADVVVVPSLFEAFGRTVIEAWSHKKPVIASKNVALAESISAETGILVDYGDHEALAKAINMLLSNQNTAKSMGMKGYQLVREEFVWNKVINKLVRVYEDTAHNT